MSSTDRLSINRNTHSSRSATKWRDSVLDCASPLALFLRKPILSCNVQTLSNAHQPIEKRRRAAALQGAGARDKTPRCSSLLLCWLLLSLGLTHLPVAAQTTGAWPHPIPCRIEDGSNPDLFVMTLGDVKTAIAQGSFDPVADTVTLNDGRAITHYYRDTLGVKFYKPLDKSHFPSPPSGICTWYFYYTRINEAEVRRNATWMAENLKDYGARYVQIDDGWQGTGAKGSARNWDAINHDRFPSGMESLASYIKSLGLTPGIWLAPHGQNNDDVVKANPGVFLLKPDGTSASETWEGRFLVDPTEPSTHTYLSNLFARLSGWGYDYFKIDGQPIVVDEYRAKKEFMHAPSDDAEGLYRQTLDTIRSAIGPDRYLLGCWGIPLEGAGIMNGSRTGGDIVLGWGGFQVALQPTLQYMYLHNIVWYSDPDVMVVRSPLTLDQARVWATLQGLTGQALMTSDRLTDLGEERVELLRRVYPAVNIRPLDLFPTERYKRIWDLKVSHLGRNYDVVGVFNFGEQRKEQTYLNWADLGLPKDALVHVFDFWNKEYLGAWERGMIIEAAPTSCRVLTLLPANGRIQLLSTSRHITQGWLDLVSVSANESGELQKGVSKVVKHDSYQLRFALPRGTNYVIKRASARTDLGPLPVQTHNHQGWCTVEFTSPQTTEVTWEVEFEPADNYYHFPPSAPEPVFAERVGLDGINLGWREQYYLNAGYQVYLNGELLGCTPSASFPLRGLNPHSNYTAQVKAVWEDGVESRKAGEVKFTLASMVPTTLSLTQLDPIQTSGRWRGIEIEDKPTGESVEVGGKTYEHALRGSSNSEIEFDLKGLYDTFTTTAGIDALSSQNGSATLVILADGNEIWQSGPLKSDSEPKAVELDVTGVSKLTLRASSEGRRRSRLQVGWAEPTVRRKK